MFLDTDFLQSHEVQLILQKATQEDPEKNWLPAYHFAICDLYQRGMREKCVYRIDLL